MFSEKYLHNLLIVIVLGVLLMIVYNVMNKSKKIKSVESMRDLKHGYQWNPLGKNDQPECNCGYWDQWRVPYSYGEQGKYQNLYDHPSFGCHKCNQAKDMEVEVEKPEEIEKYKDNTGDHMPSGYMDPAVGKSLIPASLPHKKEQVEIIEMPTYPIVNVDGASECLASNICK